MNTALAGLPLWGVRPASGRTSRGLLAFFNQAQRQRKTVYGYGASTKGNVILQFCNITACRCPPSRKSMRISSAHTRPKRSSRLPLKPTCRAVKPDYLLILPWHFRASIIRREADYLAGGGKLVFPLPHIDVVADPPEELRP